MLLIVNFIEAVPFMIDCVIMDCYWLELKTEIWGRLWQNIDDAFFFIFKHLWQCALSQKPLEKTHPVKTEHSYEYFSNK